MLLQVFSDFSGLIKLSALIQTRRDCKSILCVVFSYIYQQPRSKIVALLDFKTVTLESVHEFKRFIAIR